MSGPTPGPGVEGPPSHPEERGPDAFVGRAEERRNMHSVLALVARSRRGGVVWVRGGRGVGKTRLLEWCVEESRRLGTPTLLVPAERRPGGPFPLLESLDGFLEQLPPETFMELVGAGLLDLLPVFLRREPRLARSGWARGIKEAPELHPDADRLRFHHTLMRFLALLSGGRGVVLALDDLDQADGETRDILRFVVGSARRDAVLVVAASRAAEPRREPQRRAPADLSQRSESSERLQTIAQELFGTPPTLVLDLPPLPLEEMASLVTGLLEEGVAAALPAAAKREVAMAVARASGGSPQLARLLTPLCETLGIVEGRASGAALVTPERLATLPGNHRELARRSATLLPPRRLAMLEALAAFGAPCLASQLADITGMTASEVAEEIATCQRLGILAQLPGPASSVVFSFGELAELLIGRMEGTTRRRIHERIADLLEESPSSPLSLVAMHRIESGDAARGFRAAFDAGQAAKAVFHNSEALDLLGRAVHLEAQHPDLVDRGAAAAAREALGDVQTIVGSWPAALENYRAATVRSLQIDSRVGAARSHRKSGEILEQLGQIDEARTAYERGLALLDSRDPAASDRPSGSEAAEAAEAAGLQASLAWLVGHLRGEHARGIALYESCLEIGRRLGDARLQARALNGLGVLLNDKGDWAVAVEAYERAMRLNESIGDRLGASSNYNNLAVIFAARSDPSRAFRYYRRSLRIDKEIGNVRGVAIDYNNMGTLCFKMGQWTRSLRYYDRCRTLALQLGDQGILALSDTNQGEARLHRGELELSERCLRRAADIYRELGQGSSLAGVAATLGLLNVRAGRLVEASAHIEEATRLMVDAPLSVQVDVVVNAAELALARGDDERAEELCVQASRMAHRLSLDDTMGDIYAVFGRVKAVQGEWQEALGFFARALDVFRGLDQPYRLGKALLAYGEHLLSGDEDGRPFVEKARDMFAKLGARPDEARAESLLA